jgi:hypothetical protein
MDSNKDIHRGSDLARLFSMISSSSSHNRQPWIICGDPQLAYPSHS